ncbi:histone-fold-containing protein [Xylariaceae sp. FL0804]|nr:histone-fold-containing protein [Xylariaceae sp. FL0804]
MPYNTTAIPPRKEVTGQTQLPLSRVKKIIAQDADIHVCSNNAAFVVCLATELFIQHLAGEGQNMTKLERKPRRNIQYKDLASAVAHQDRLQFLEDVVPRTVAYRAVRAQAAATRAQLSGGVQQGQGQGVSEAEAESSSFESRNAASRGAGGGQLLPNGKKHRASGGGGGRASLNGGGGGRTSSVSLAVEQQQQHAASADPDDQLQSEMRHHQASRGGGGGGREEDTDDDVDMTG